MKKVDAVVALPALAQDNRLDVFRLLVQAGPEGVAAGEIADKLGISASNMTFHLDRLRDAGLIGVRREGRSMIYAARYESMRALVDFLTENCCGDAKASDRSAPSA
jgi:DNA-binding transcriptional ArsR family regulator